MAEVQNMAQCAVSMSERAHKVARLFFAAILLVGGAGFYSVMVRTRPLPQMVGDGGFLPTVQVQVVSAKDGVSPVVVYGTVRPRHQVNLIPLVSGRITQVHPNFATGRILEEGETIFEIDSTVYRAKLNQAAAEIAALQAVYSRQLEEQCTSDKRVENAKELLSIDEAEWETSSQLLVEEKIGSPRELDVARQRMLRTQAAFLEVANAASVSPYALAETRARLDSASARLGLAQYELDNTRVLSPFRARVDAAGAFTSQVVTAFFSVGSLTGTSLMEIAVGVPADELQWLDEAIQPARLLEDSPLHSPSVEIQWSGAGTNLSWTGRVTRFERVDEATRTARMVVEVRPVDAAASEDPIPADLSLGMFCRADLPGRLVRNAALIPSLTIHEKGWVFVVAASRDSGGVLDDVGVLSRRKITPLRSIGDQTLVELSTRDDGVSLQSGDRIITSVLRGGMEGKTVRAMVQPASTQVTGLFVPVEKEIGPECNRVAKITIDRGALHP